MANPVFDFSDPDARSFCPQCGGAFALASGSCHLCGVALIGRAAAEAQGSAEKAQTEEAAANDRANAPVLIVEAKDAVEANGIAAHLEAAGIPFVTRRKSEGDPFRMQSPIEFMVAPRDVAAANEVLAEVGELTDEEWEQMYGQGEAPEGFVDDEEKPPNP
jgi:hypothetical protein